MELQRYKIIKFHLLSLYYVICSIVHYDVLWKRYVLKKFKEWYVPFFFVCLCYFFKRTNYLNGKYTTFWHNLEIITFILVLLLETVRFDVIREIWIDFNKENITFK